MKLEFYQLTSAGDRDINQDAMGRIIGEDFGLFIVADGLGGHHAGEKASRFFCQGILQSANIYLAGIKQTPVKSMTDLFNSAIEEMKALFGNDPSAFEAHTTCALLYVDSTLTIAAHCGDSRIYRMNANKILWRTKDHSRTQELLENGSITEREMGLHPEQNQLTRSVNILQSHPPEIHVYPPIKLGETFLLCTDGFWEHVKSAEFMDLAQPQSGKNELGKIARLSVLRARGRSDNVTVQWIRCTG